MVEVAYPIDVRMVGGPVRGILASWEPPAPAAARVALSPVNGGAVWSLFAGDVAVPDECTEVHRYELDGDPVDDVATYRYAERER